MKKTKKEINLELLHKTYKIHYEMLNILSGRTGYNKGIMVDNDELAKEYRGLLIEYDETYEKLEKSLFKDKKL